MKIEVILDNNRIAVYESPMPARTKEVFDLYTIKTSTYYYNTYYKIKRKEKVKNKIILINDNGVWKEYQPERHHAPGPMIHGKDSKFRPLGNGAYITKII